jgi:hypothetical protein
MSRAAGHPRGRGSRGGAGLKFLITVAVIVVLLVIIDFGARAVAESELATKIQQQGLPRKPDVSIDGFPFLTQVAAKDFSQVNIAATNVPEGYVTISKINATGRQIKLNSYAFRSGTITSLSGTALISFASLASTLTQQIGPLGAVLNGAGLKLTAAGPHKVRATLNLVVTTGSATWRVALLSGQNLRISLAASSGLPASLISAMSSVTLHIPSLPLGLAINSVSVTAAGVVGQISGHDVPFGK